MFLFFHFLHFNVPNNKCHKQKWGMLFFTRIKLVVHVLAFALVITRIKWIRLKLWIYFHFLDSKKTQKRTVTTHAQSDDELRSKRLAFEKNKLFDVRREIKILQKVKSGHCFCCDCVHHLCVLCIICRYLY